MCILDPIPGRLNLDHISYLLGGEVFLHALYDPETDMTTIDGEVDEETLRAAIAAQDLTWTPAPAPAPSTEERLAELGLDLDDLRALLGSS